MADEQFYYNPSTGEVTQGKEAAWDNRMGPYATREEAESALQIAAQRNKLSLIHISEPTRPY